MTHHAKQMGPHRHAHAVVANVVLLEQIKLIGPILSDLLMDYLSKPFVSIKCKLRATGRHASELAPKLRDTSLARKPDTSPEVTRAGAYLIRVNLQSATAATHGHGHGICACDNQNLCLQRV